MLKSNLASLIAIAAGAFAVDDVPRPRNRNVRTVKVRPKNYTHPMVTSSDDEIREHNAKVTLAKSQRDGRRMFERTKLLGNGIIIDFVPLRHRTRGTTSYLKRAMNRVTYGVGVAV